MDEVQRLRQQNEDLEAMLAERRRHKDAITVEFTQLKVWIGPFIWLYFLNMCLLGPA